MLLTSVCTLLNNNMKMLLWEAHKVRLVTLYLCVLYSANITLLPLWLSRTSVLFREVYSSFTEECKYRFGKLRWIKIKVNKCLHRQSKSKNKGLCGFYKGLRKQKHHCIEYLTILFMLLVFHPPTYISYSVSSFSFLLLIQLSIIFLGIIRILDLPSDRFILWQSREWVGQQQWWLTRPLQQKVPPA